jgi:Tol biopolymer transport system component
MIRLGGLMLLAALLLVPSSNARPSELLVVLRTDWVPGYRTADLYVVPLHTGPRRPLTRNEVDDVYPTWSPDGRTIVFTRRGDLFAMSRTGRALRRLTRTSMREFDATWSPDGRRLAFVGGRGGREQIYVMNSDGSGRRQVSHEPSCAGHPSWSPDGLRILGTTAFCSDTAALFSIRPDGTDRQLIQTGPPEDQSDTQPVLSPNGKWLAFTRVLWQLNTTQLWIARADGTAARRLIKDAEQPTWSPGGRQLAFAHGPRLAGDAKEGYYQVGGPKVSVIRADGAHLRHLTPEPDFIYGGVGPFSGWRWSQAGVRIIGLSWSPDGSSLAYGHRYEKRQPDIAVVAADSLRSLIRDRVIEASAELSPDGRHVSYARFPRVGGPVLHVVGVDGRHNRSLGVRGWRHSWSPDGRRLVYHGRDGLRIVRASGADDRRLVADGKRSFAGSPVWPSGGDRIFFTRTSKSGATAIWSVAPDGSRPVRVARAPRYLSEFDVSPDGTQIVFAGAHRLFVMHSDGSGRRRLGPYERRGVATPAWCRDGRTIVFASRRDRDWDLYAMTSGGRVIAKLTDNLADDYEPDC